MKKINTVGVIGAGTMGSAIAQKFAQEGFVVYLNDREQKFVDKGIDGIKSVLMEGVERKIFTVEKVEAIMSKIHGTTNQQDLESVDLIVEAVFEDFDVKFNLFKVLDGIVPADAIIATNTSSFSVSELSEAVSHPERFIGMHYFYHAAKNRLVEIIPGAKTSQGTYKSMQAFSVKSGKDAITTKDSYGFAVNRFFVPWLNESARLLEEGIGSIAEIDAVCMKLFGIGMGPFALMNATGVPVAMHSQKTLERYGNSYKVSPKLVEQVARGQNWDVSGTDEVQVSAETQKTVSDRMLGVVMFVCSQIFEEKVCSAVDLNRGAKIGLRWRKGPVDLMIQNGAIEVQRLVDFYADIHDETAPEVNANLWQMEFVTLDKRSSRAIITMSRPEDMNALNENVMVQLDEKFTAAESDSEIDMIILTGSGKAFVAGADIKFFVQNIKQNRIDDIYKFTEYGQNVVKKIDNSSKKVVIILNGLALGGGMELALCGDVILADPKVKIAFPETGIGIYPGLGGTQRTASRMGKGLAKYVVLTGQMLGAKEACEIGLIDGIVSYDEMFDIMHNSAPIPEKLEVKLSDNWKSIQDLFDNNSYKQIIAGNYSNSAISPEVAAKIGKAMSFKAPIAMNFAEELIEKAEGQESELAKLRTIFSTKDALLGLTSIGKRVEYTCE